MVCIKDCSSDSDCITEMIQFRYNIFDTSVCDKLYGFQIRCIVSVSNTPTQLIQNPTIGRV